MGYVIAVIVFLVVALPIAFGFAVLFSWLFL